MKCDFLPTSVQKNRQQINKRAELGGTIHARTGHDHDPQHICECQLCTCAELRLPTTPCIHTRVTFALEGSGLSQDRPWPATPHIEIESSLHVQATPLPTRWVDVTVCMVVQVLIPVGRGLWAMYLLSTIMVCAAVTSVPQLVDASVRPGGVLPRCTEGDSNDVSLSLFTPLVQRVQIGGGVELTLPLFGVDMVLNLTRAGEIVHHSWRQYSASNDTKTGAIHTGRQAMMFTGHIVGETGSSVWLTLPHGNTLSAVIGGVLLSGESTTLSMQPEADAVSSPSSVVKVTCHTVVADDKALRYHTDDHQHNHEAKRKPHSPVHTQRGRRDGPLSSSHTACPVFVDVDLSFHEQWGGSGTSAQRMERTAGVVAGIIGQVSDLYEAQLSITLPLMGVHIRTTTVSPIPSSGGSELGGYETWLTGDGPSTRSAAASALPRGEGTPTASQSCLNMLLV